MRPAGAEPSEFGAALLPTNLSCVRKFEQLPLSRAKGKIAPQIIAPSQQNGKRPIDFCGVARPHGCQSFSFSKAALVSFARRIVMRVHNNRFGTVRHFVTLRTTPPRVFVILRVLHFLEKAAP